MHAVAAAAPQRVTAMVAFASQFMSFAPKEFHPQKLDDLFTNGKAYGFYGL